jgi:hypothetical protein
MLSHKVPVHDVSVGVWCRLEDLFILRPQIHAHILQMLGRHML